MHRFSPLFLLLLAGCSKPDPATYPVEGDALFLGKPAEGFIVEFSSQAAETKGLNASGKVGADGKFTLKSMVNGKEKEGAVAGPHKVVVIPPPVGSGPAVIALVPLRYVDYGSSGLTFEVKPGASNQYRIPLER